MEQQNLTEDEATLVLLSVTYALACVMGEDTDALNMLENIVCSGSEGDLINRAKSILDKLDVKVIKPINKLPC